MRRLVIAALLCLLSGGSVAQQGPPISLEDVILSSPSGGPPFNPGDAMPIMQGGVLKRVPPGSVGAPAGSSGNIQINGASGFGAYAGSTCPVGQVPNGLNASGAVTGCAPAGGGTPANPTATAGPAAVNGVASTFMRSDAAPAVQKGSLTQYGVVLEHVFNAKDYGWTPDGTDHSTQALALLTAVNAAGGGTIYFPPASLAYRADSQLLIPNDAQTIPHQVNIRMTGGGGGQLWGDVARTQVGATVLDLRYTAVDGNAKIESRGSGSLEIDNLTITDKGTANATPFIHSTNTTLSIHDNTFIGSGSATQDAIVLGGTGNITPGSGVTAPFQGYGTVINSNHFRSLNRGVYGRTFANSIIVTNNSWLASTGTRAIEFASVDDIVYAPVVTGNLIEMTAPMQYGIVLQGVQFGLFQNSFYDKGVSYVSDYRLVKAGTSQSCYHNTMIELLSQGTRITQIGDSQQLTVTTYLASSALTNLQGDGIAANILTEGLDVAAIWNAANASAGGVTVRDLTNPGQLLAMGVNSGRALIDANDSGGFNRELQLQPRGGPVTTYATMAYRPSAVTLANGLNFNIALAAIDNTAKSSFIRVTGPTGAFSLGGFSSKVSGSSSWPGSILHVYNTTSQAMTIVNEDVSSTAANRIKTLTGANVTLRTGTSMASFIYDDTDARWILMSTN